MSAIDILIKEPKPYMFKTIGKFLHSHVLIFDKTEIGKFYLDSRDMQRIVDLMNAAYFEGYLQKEREINF